LNSVANSMHPEKSQAGLVTDKIQKTLGLSEFGVSSTEYYDPASSSTGNTSSVNIGKKLGKNLSVHYTVGLFYPVSILNLRYKLNKHVILQTETSTVETGADVIYSIERK